MAFSFDALVLGPCTAAFGEAAQGYPVPVCTPASGAPAFAADGVFDRAYRAVDQDSALPVVATQPRLGVRLAAFPPGRRPSQGDLWLIRGDTYVVREVRLDGHGEAGLLLNLNGAG